MRWSYATLESKALHDFRNRSSFQMAGWQTFCCCQYCISSSTGVDFFILQDRGIVVWKVICSDDTRGYFCGGTSSATITGMLFYQFNLKLLPHDKLETPRQLLETECVFASLLQHFMSRCSTQTWVFNLSFDSSQLIIQIATRKLNARNNVCLCLYICGKVGSYKPWYATATMTLPLCFSKPLLAPL